MCFLCLEKNSKIQFNPTNIYKYNCDSRYKYKFGHELKYHTLEKLEYSLSIQIKYFKGTYLENIYYVESDKYDYLRNLK